MLDSAPTEDGETDFPYLTIVRTEVMAFARLNMRQGHTKLTNWCADSSVLFCSAAFYPVSQLLWMKPAELLVLALRVGKSMSRCCVPDSM